MLDKSKIITDQTQIVAYAEDLTIIASTKAELIRAIEKVEKEAKRFGLEIS